MNKKRAVLNILLMSLFASTTSHAEEVPMISAEEEMANLKMIYGDEDAIAIATGTLKPLHLAPAVASVISANDIKRMGATTLDEALAMVPGLHVSISNVNRLNSVYSIRGIHTGQSPQVLMTINGAPFKENINSSRINNFSLPVANISRIEIIRGPGSAVHGADAFSGVINIVTKNIDELSGLETGLRLGSFDSKDFWVQYGGKAQDWNMIFSLEYADTDGDPRRKVNGDLASNLQALGLTIPSLANSYPLQSRSSILNSYIGINNDRWNINFSNWAQRDGGTGPGAAQAIDPIGGTKNAFYQLDINYQFAEKLKGWELSSRLNLQHIRENNIFRVFAPGATIPIGKDGNLFTAPNSGCPKIGPLSDPKDATSATPLCLANFSNGVFGLPDFQQDNNFWEINALYKDWKNHLVRINTGFNQQHLTTQEHKNFGPGTPAAQLGNAAPPASTAPIWVIPGTLTDVTGTSDIYITNQKRNAWFFAAQDEWQLSPDWTLTGGARYDHFSDFGSTFNPRLALIWAMNYNLTGKALFGTAFRAPSFYEQFAQNNPSVTGNSQLKPEKIQTIELAFDYRPTLAWQHNFNTFYYQAKQLIDYVSLGNGNNQAQNLNNQDGYGFELASKWKPVEELQINAAFAWQHAQNKANNSTVPDAPSRKLSTSLLWKPAYEWSIYSSVHWVMDRTRALGDTRSKIPDYALTDLTVRRTFNNNIELATSLRNVFNANAREPSNGGIVEDFPLEHRSFFAELRYNFSKRRF